MPRSKKIKVVERKLGLEKAIGQAFMGEGLIEIDPRQLPRQYLSTLIHEALHLAMPDASESKVERVSQLVAGVLWRQNYRKVKQ